MPKRTAATALDTCCELFRNGKRPSANANGTGAVAISASVGINGQNLPADVRTIQDALNRISPANGGPATPLVVDGICGGKTRNAIQQFQLKQFGWSGADGRVDPGGPTNRRLNELVGGPARPMDTGYGAGTKMSDAPDGLLLLGLTSALHEARRWIHAAVQNLDIALAHLDEPDDSAGPLTSFGRAQRVRLANRYFRIDEFPAASRRVTLERIQVVFITMLQVSQRPAGLWGEKAFAIDRSGVAYSETKTAAAHTNYGGYFRPGQPSIYEDGLRGDMIFFVRENIDHFAHYPRGIKTIVHELAHFCGDHRAGWAVLDFDAWGEPEDPKVAALTLDQRVRHADCYARFAQAAAT